MNRFEFQRKCVVDTSGIVLNIGSKEDPARLKELNSNTLNCDISTWDSDYEQHIPIDVVFDCREMWPFKDDAAELVVMGDILEHLYRHEAKDALKEAARVAFKLCVTVPMNANSHRLQGGAELWERSDGSRGHCTDWGVDNMGGVLKEAGWWIVELHIIDGIVVPEGLLVKAKRNE